MIIISVLLPMALALSLAFLVAFIVAARSGQYEDLETPAHRMLLDDEMINNKERKT